MLKKLCNALSPSGMEENVRKIIMEEIKPYCDNIKIDKMGNLIAFKRGKSSDKKFMADAHMDEVGLIVKNITEKGYIKFDEIGGLDNRLLPGKRVLVGEKAIPGVIGVKAIHLTTSEEREKAVKTKDMYIDIGVQTREEALELVAKGDYISFDSDYVSFGEGLIKAKALDDRAGVYILINMLKKAKPAYDFYAVFSVGEEIGLRGAMVSAKEIMADYAVILESTICADSPTTPKHLQVTRLGEGPVFSVMERSSLADIDMLSFAKKIAHKAGICYQLKRTGNGGNNAGKIQVAGRGTKTLAMAIPCRYLHSPVCVISEKDLQLGEKLAIEICERMDEICLEN
ncbi:MAG: M42 family peptidase [Clostridia bacterium]|nr:M42 family peptidase [Clostridia bacterium]